MTPEPPSDGNDKLAAAGGLRQLRRFTPARIAIGRAGSGQPTAASLQFALDHARARDAARAAPDFGQLEQSLVKRGWSVIRAKSAARERSEYLRRPDLGRQLSAEGRLAVAGKSEGSDVAIVAADGLSASAIEANLLPTLDHLRPLLLSAGLAVGPLALVELGRVAIGDEIGRLLNAKLVAVLIGERPGLSSADSLGAYITWRPRVGTMDSCRNCVSNIRPAGLAPEDAAKQIFRVIEDAFAHGATGVQLNDLRLAAQAACNAQRAPPSLDS